MKIYKAFVTDKMNGKRVAIEGECNTKTEFIHDLRANGYAVNPTKVKTKEVFEYIMEHTDCNPWDWEINKIPNPLTSL